MFLALTNKIRNKKSENHLLIAKRRNTRRDADAINLRR